MTLKPNPITGVVGAQSRDDVDGAVQAEFLESLPGETEFDQIAKAQATAPHVTARIVALEDCLWSVTEALMVHEKETSPLVERAKLLLKNRLEINS
jgi:hypothetical protein